MGFKEYIKKNLASVKVLILLWGLIIFSVFSDFFVKAEVFQSIVKGLELIFSLFMVIYVIRYCTKSEKH